MHRTIARLRSTLGRKPRPAAPACEDEGQACSWDEMRAVYEEQAARGVPGAKAGLELIEQGRWPSSGRPRKP